MSSAPVTCLLPIHVAQRGTLPPDLAHNLCHTGTLRCQQHESAGNQHLLHREPSVRKGLSHYAFLIPQIRKDPFHGGDNRGRENWRLPRRCARIHQSWGCGLRVGLGVPGAHRLRSDSAPTHHGQWFRPNIPATPGCFLDTKTECGENANINQVSGASFP